MSNVHDPRPSAVEEHSSLLADWTIIPDPLGFLVEERVGSSVREFGPVQDEAAAETLIALRRDEMEEHVEAMVRLTRLSHH